MWFRIDQESRAEQITAMGRGNDVRKGQMYLLVSDVAPLSASTYVPKWISCEA